MVYINSKYGIINHNKNTDVPCQPSAKKQGV